MRGIPRVWLIGLGVAAAVLVIVVLQFVSNDSGPDTPRATPRPAPTQQQQPGGGNFAPAPVPPSSSAPTLPPQAVPGGGVDVGNGQGGVVTSPAVARQWTATLNGFGRNFTNSGPGWFDRMRPLVSPDLAENMQYTDPGLIPQGEYRDFSITARTEFPSVAAVLNYAGGLRIQVTAYPGPQGPTGPWQIASYDQAQ